METKSLEQNLRFYALFKILRDPLFWGPVLITYIVNIGKMELSELYFMEAVVVSGLIFAEIYSSAWADLLGRKRMLLLGSFCQLIAVILFSLLDSPLLVWVANIFTMIGIALISGVDEAFLADTLKSSGRFAELTRINGRVLAKRFALIAVSCVASGYLYAINPRLPMFLSIPGVLLSFLSVFFLSEPEKKVKAGHREHFNLMKLSFIFVANHKALKWIIAFSALIVVSSKLWFFTYNPYFELVDLSPEYYGWIFFILNMVAWFSSRFAYLAEEKIPEGVLIALMILFIGLPISLMGSFVSQIAIGYIFFQNLTRGFKDTFFNTFINRHLDSHNRATVLSINSAIQSLIGAICLWLFGLILARFNLAQSLQILGGTILVIGAYIVFAYYRIFAKT